MKQQQQFNSETSDQKKLTSIRVLHIYLKVFEISRETVKIERVNIQGDPNQKLLIQMTITLKICISDPMLVKPKCVWKVYIYFENCK